MEPSLAHRLLADATDSEVADWRECEGPSQKGAPPTAWFVRRQAGQPDVYAAAYGDAEEMTIELIPAVDDEKDAFAVVRGVLGGRTLTELPDIACGVVFRGRIVDGPRP